MILHNDTSSLQNSNVQSFHHVTRLTQSQQNEKIAQLIAERNVLDIHEIKKDAQFISDCLSLQTLIVREVNNFIQSNIVEIKEKIKTRERFFRRGALQKFQTKSLTNRESIIDPRLFSIDCEIDLENRLNFAYGEIFYAQSFSSLVKLWLKNLSVTPDFKHVEDLNSSLAYAIEKTYNLFIDIKRAIFLNSRLTTSYAKKIKYYTKNSDAKNEII